MNPLEFFMLTARQYDRAQQFYNTNDRAMMEQAKEYEKQQLEEFIRVAKLRPEILGFFALECPFIYKRVQKALEAEKQAEAAKLQQSLFN